MMLTCKTLYEKWNNIPMYVNGYQLLDGNHPVDIYIGYEELNQKTLLILNAREFVDLPSSKSIIAHNFQRADGSWAISFRLVQIKNEDVFIRLCWDIIESSRDEKKDAVGYIVGRYLKWQKLMAHQRPDIMDTSRQKGLIGELHYLKFLSQKEGNSKAIDSWVGPEGADQDFIFEDHWSEIKATLVSSVCISISSLEQLDTTFAGDLVVVFLDKTAPGDASGFTLTHAVNEARRIFESEARLLEKLEIKLFQYGYKDSKEYEIQKYILSGESTYRVDDTFPKLTKKNVPFQIIGAKYTISLAAIEMFKI